MNKYIESDVKDGLKLLKIGFNSERSKYGLVIVKTTKRKPKH